MQATCGGCGSIELLTHVGEDGVLHAVCVTCQRLQEPETRDDPERELCDNCAFRPGSPERGDNYGFMRILETVQTGQPFFCHKGLAAKLTEGSIDWSENTAATAKSICAGWLARRKAYLARSK